MKSGMLGLGLDTFLYHPIISLFLGYIVPEPTYITVINARHRERYSTFHYLSMKMMVFIYNMWDLPLNTYIIYLHEYVLHLLFKAKLFAGLVTYAFSPTLWTNRKETSSFRSLDQ